MAKNRKQQIKGNLKGNKNRAPEKPLTAPLTTKEARGMANADARAEYGPTIRAAKGMKRGSVERQKNIGQWFQGLGDTINQSAAATDASYGQANAALLAHMNAAQQAAAQSQGQIGQDMSDMVALTGADPSLTTPALAEGAAAANQRNIAGAALAAPIAQAGASQAGYLRNTGINAQREGISQKLGEAKRRDEISQDLTALRKERAQKTVGNFYDIRSEEGDRAIQRRAFPEQQADRQLQREEGEANREIDWYNAKTGRKNTQGGGGGLSPDEKQDVRQGRQNALITVRNLYSAAKKPPTTPEGWAAFTQLVASEEEISPQEAQWAVNRFRNSLRKKERGSAVEDAAGDVAGGLY